MYRVIFHFQSTFTYTSTTFHTFLVGITILILQEEELKLSYLLHNRAVSMEHGDFHKSPVPGRELFLLHGGCLQIGGWGESQAGRRRGEADGNQPQG